MVAVFQCEKMLIDRSGYICSLYNKYSTDLLNMLERQNELASRWDGDPYFDDIEGELLYLLIREKKPQVCVEIGTGSGWATSWILQGLLDNKSGFMTTIDSNKHVVGKVTVNIPAELSKYMEFHNVFAEDYIDSLPESADFLHLDAIHTSRFVSWFIKAYFSKVHGTICVHDVYYQAQPLKTTSWGYHTAVPLFRYLDEKNIDHYTPCDSIRRTHMPIVKCRDRLGIVNIKEASINSTVVFEHE